MKYDKSYWIALFTQKVSDEKVKICSRLKNYKDQASEINKYIQNMREESIRWIKEQSEKMSQIDLLNQILTITYASYIVMLDARNAVWPYEYMAFARRMVNYGNRFVNFHLNIH